MTVTVSKPAVNLREELSALKKISGIKGEELLRANAVDDVYASLNPTMFRNRIINGDMRIDQRFAGTSSNPSGDGGYFTVDRFRTFRSQASKYTIQQNLNSITPPDGFTNYLGVASSSSYSILSTDYFMLNTRVEGYNFSDFMWGTTNAKPATLSFWVRSSLTGKFSASLTNGNENYCYPFLYDIQTANVWTKISVTIPGANTGTWVGGTNGIGVSVWFGLGIGSTNSGPSGAWASTTYYGATGATSVVGTNAATFYITGVQLEKGTVATPFEYRPYGTELSLCQRYFQIIGGTSTEHWATGVLATDRINIVYSFKQTMRSSPSWTATSFGSSYSYLNIWYGTAATAVTGTNENYSSPNTISIGLTHGTSTTPGAAGYIYFNNTAARIAFSAEL